MQNKLRACVLTWLTCVQMAFGLGPQIGVANATLDTDRLSEADRRYTRYIDLGHFEGREDFVLVHRQVLDWANNARSRERFITRMRQVTPHLYAVHLTHYTWSIERWEKLASFQARECYYHMPAVPTDTKSVVDPNKAAILERYKQGVKEKGQSVNHLYDQQTGQAIYGDSAKKIIADWTVAWEDEQRRTAKPQPATVNIRPGAGKFVQRAFWLPGMNELCKRCYTEVPIVRGDWFINRTMIQENREGFGYYDWLELGKSPENLHKLIGIDLTESRIRNRLMADATDDSGVARNNRGYERHQTPDGAFWTTLDFESSIDFQNVLTIQQGLYGSQTDPAEGDASEVIFHLPNRMLGYWLQQNKDKAKVRRQDKVPPEIASDKHGARNDLIIHVGMSCARCHIEGYRTPKTSIRDRRTDKTPPYTLGDELALKLAQTHRNIYNTPILEYLKEDNDRFAKAMLLCNGLTPKENALRLAEVWEYYLLPLYPADCARELGMGEQEYLAMIVASGLSKNPIFAGQLQVPALTVRREHWEEWQATVWYGVLLTMGVDQQGHMTSLRPY